MTQVFISWSGDLSKAIAEELRKWIPSVLQFTKPYFTPNDIEKGTKWASEISLKLSESNVGIICLTRENLDKPWILFEAGALSKNLEEARICSILFDLDSADLTGPLMTFQSTHFEKADFKKLIHTINDASGDRKLERDTLDQVFDMWWPQLESKVNAILSEKPKDKKGELRTERELLEEILDLSRLTTQRIRGRESEVAAGALLHLNKAAKKILVEAIKEENHDIAYAVRDIVEISEHINDRSIRSPSVNREIKELGASCDDAIQRINQAKSVDDEIPF